MCATRKKKHISTLLSLAVYMKTNKINFITLSVEALSGMTLQSIEKKFQKEKKNFIYILSFSKQKIFRKKKYIICK